MKEFIIGFILGIGQGMIILDWLKDKRVLKAVAEMDDKK